jgi:hypothetical protein
MTSDQPPDVSTGQRWTVVKLYLTAQSHEELVAAVTQLKETHGGRIDLILPVRPNHRGEWEAAGGMWVETRLSKQLYNL